MAFASQAFGAEEEDQEPNLVKLYNLALGKLGASLITSVDEDSENRRFCDACYEHLRDVELRARAWKFAIKREALTASTDVPVPVSSFASGVAFPLPDDYIRIILPPEPVDWVFEFHQNERAIITQSSSLTIRFVFRNENIGLWDECFIEMVACKMASHMCEAITQSTAKQAAIEDQYIKARNLARQMNAYESTPSEPVDDVWLRARIHGNVSAPWLRMQ